MDNKFTCTASHPRDNAPAMHAENPITKSENDLDSLMERIKSGIDEYGIYVIDEANLELIWSLYQPRSDFEKQMHVNNFAEAFGFQVYVSGSLQVAIFRKPG